MGEREYITEIGGRHYRYEWNPETNQTDYVGPVEQEEKHLRNNLFYPRSRCGRIFTNQFSLDTHNARNCSLCVEAESKMMKRRVWGEMRHGESDEEYIDRLKSAQSQNVPGTFYTNPVEVPAQVVPAQVARRMVARRMESLEEELWKEAWMQKREDDESEDRRLPPEPSSIVPTVESVSDSEAPIHIHLHLGDVVEGDKVKGDKVGGDKVIGDSLNDSVVTTKHIHNDSGIDTQDKKSTYEICSCGRVECDGCQSVRTHPQNGE